MLDAVGQLVIVGWDARGVGSTYYFDDMLVDFFWWNVAILH